MNFFHSPQSIWDYSLLGQFSSLLSSDKIFLIYISPWKSIAILFLVNCLIFSETANVEVWQHTQVWLSSWASQERSPSPPRWRPSWSGVSAERGSTTMFKSTTSHNHGLLARLSVHLFTIFSQMHSTTNHLSRLGRDYYFNSVTIFFYKWKHSHLLKSSGVAVYFKADDKYF